MALSPSSAPTSPLPRQLLRYVSSQLVAALHRPAPIISLPSAPRGVDAAASQLLRSASRAAPSPKGRPGAPRQGSGGQVHLAAPAMATIAARAVMPLRRPTPPGPPAQGSGGKIHTAPAAATARVVMRGPAPPGPPAQGSGGKVHAVSPAATAARVLMRGPAPPGPPAEGAGGRGGNIHAVLLLDS
ncbi:unnamed protein product [Miscanthus lutarioriparius]|uniref:Uncharacterized protein n=1 Tax=Miscanthus lutarioriparius TaxID=422564 RepID=A0A811PMW2_9POAL|nr:unnamed protein product [Miscanthus lutarioriparius]